MAIMRTLDLQCDVCSQWEHGGGHRTARKVRRDLYIDGWRRRRIDGKLLDLCPDCVMKLEEKAEVNDVATE